MNFDGRLIPYAMGFGLCYAAAWVGTVMAVRYGLMAISTLIISCALIFPAVYGFLMGDPLTATGIIGHIPNTILYPTNAALSMIFTFLVSFFFYKERFSMPQYLGYGLGAAAIVLLNI